MKTLGIIGIVLSSIMILLGLSVITSEGVWIIVLAFAYFLALSIKTLK